MQLNCETNGYRNYFSVASALYYYLTRDKRGKVQFKLRVC